MENNTQITVADLAVIKNLIELASNRGAFKAEELSSVGRVYDKLNLFLTKLVKEAEEAELAANPSATSVSGETDA